MVKKVILTGINAKSVKNMLKGLRYDRFEEKSANEYRKNTGGKVKPIIYDELLKISLDPLTVVDAFKKVHPVIAKYLCSNYSNKLMFEESEIMTDILLELMRLGIPALPIHDSLLFPYTHTETVREVMLRCYRNRTGFEIQVK